MYLVRFVYKINYYCKFIDKYERAHMLHQYNYVKMNDEQNDISKSCLFWNISMSAYCFLNRNQIVNCLFVLIIGL